MRVYEILCVGLKRISTIAASKTREDRRALAHVAFPHAEDSHLYVALLGIALEPHPEFRAPRLGWRIGGGEEMILHALHTNMDDGGRLVPRLGRHAGCDTVAYATECRATARRYE